MLAALLIFLTSLFLGWWLLEKTQIELENNLQVVIGFVVGLVCNTLLLFFLGIVGWFVPIVIVLTQVGIILLVSITRLRQFLQLKVVVTRFISGFKNLTKREKFLGILLFIIPIWLFGRSIFYAADGSLVAGDRLVWTDWPVHLGIAANFAWGPQKWTLPPPNPIFSGNGLIYPFFADFLSAIIIKLGAGIPEAFILPGIFLTLTFFYLYVTWVKNSCYKLKWPIFTGQLALVICLFWGGLGFVYWLQESFASETTLVSTLLSPPREYTFWSEKNLWFFTFIYSEILPQRAFLFGLPLFFTILHLVRSGWEKSRSQNILLAGILAGLTPFFHTHTFISIVFLSLTVAVIVLGKTVRHKKDFLRVVAAIAFYFLPFVFIAGMQLPLFLDERSIPFVFGWMKGSENFIWFWFKNTGFFIPLVVFGWMLGKSDSFGKLVGVAAWSLFVFPNMWQFAPWGYDNLKIFTFWYLLSTPFIISALGWFWNKNLAGKILALILFASLTLSGVIEIGRIINTNKTQITLWSKSDQEVALAVREKTPADAVFLTASIHDHPVVALAGRKTIIGFPGNAWSWGLASWSERESDVRSMFRSGETAVNLWKKYEIDYIIVSNHERYFEVGLNESFIAQNSELVLEKGDARIYKVQ